MYYRARYYDPELEVFISQDPMGDAQRYVGGNPVRFTDPLGLLRRIIMYGSASAEPSLIEGTRWVANGTDYKVAMTADQLAEIFNSDIRTLLPGEPYDIVIVGHGNQKQLGAPSGLLGGGEQEIYATMDTPTDPRFSSIPNAFYPLKMHPPRSITLYSCYTGRNPFQGMAVQISRYVAGDTMVNAPTGLTNPNTGKVWEVYQSSGNLYEFGGWVSYINGIHRLK
jgi:hypothetical protein